MTPHFLYMAWICCQQGQWHSQRCQVDHWSGPMQDVASALLKGLVGQSRGLVAESGQISAQTMLALALPRPYQVHRLGRQVSRSNTSHRLLPRCSQERNFGLCLGLNRYQKLARFTDLPTNSCLVSRHSQIINLKPTRLMGSLTASLKASSSPLCAKIVVMGGQLQEVHLGSMSLRHLSHSWSFHLLS